MTTAKILLGWSQSVTVIDIADLELVTRFSWYKIKAGYVATGQGHGRRLLLHRYILSAPTGVEVDHINGDTLDNRRCNLRLCNRSENMRNRRKQAKPASSIYKGVWRPTGSTGKWHARIRIKGVPIHIGSFESQEAAAREYDSEALKHFGEFAKLNFPPEDLALVRGLFNNLKSSTTPLDGKTGAKDRLVLIQPRNGLSPKEDEHGLSSNDPKPSIKRD